MEYTSNSITAEKNHMTTSHECKFLSCSFSASLRQSTRTQTPTVTKYVPCDIVVDSDDEILVLVLEEVLEVGYGLLETEFSGVLNEHLKGLYRCTYSDKGEKKNMAASQFEAVDARRCFPCWDEPALKATFEITLENIPSELTALSNMPVSEEKVHGNLKTVHFEESILMSTHLVAVVVGLFDYVEDTTEDGIKVRSYCPVVPEFAGGAMENYGLITFRESELLLDALHSAAANIQRQTIVLAHEVAHHWFGNLVTMEWWTHLWLNEGFATWVSYLVTDKLFPEWNIWNLFLQETEDSLQMDALEKSHPIEVEIPQARAVLEYFDDISYRKGCSVIRMLENFLGDEIFQKSLASYMKKFGFSNAKTEDLWKVISETSGVEVDKIMNMWTKQKGYPVIAVKLKGTTCEFEQAHFLSSALDSDAEWIVPVTLCVASYENQMKFLLEAKYGQLDIGDLENDEENWWIKTNVHQAGFYRTKEEATNRLRAFLEDKNTPLLPVNTRKAAYVAMMRNTSIADKTGLKWLLKLYKEVDAVQEKTRILRCVGSSPDPAIVSEVLDFVLSDEVPQQDIIYVLWVISWEGRATAWAWLKENWDLERRCFLLISYETLSHRDDMANKAEAFFGGDDALPSIALNLKQNLEKVRIKARWVEHIKEETQLLVALVEKLATKIFNDYWVEESGEAEENWDAWLAITA
ncbi:hypothetical protein SASPL_139424 [Salvia splendens]|uniref:Alpha-aminoacylpeptide hydrolase n=1 Tax=Salvia splendens TaxID=180675 RepID=A0A8X8WQ21_SALSN|nr:hypothetical protein SASPL_139424 [Salvia splendens]